MAAACYRLCFVLLFLLLPHPPEFFSLLGWIGLLSACSLWLSRSYKRKAPLSTRGGRLLYESQPRLYRSGYLRMALVRLFAAFCLIGPESPAAIRKPQKVVAELGGNCVKRGQAPQLRRTPGSRGLA
jgi:hypothetical protein